MAINPYGFSLCGVKDPYDTGYSDCLIGRAASLNEAVARFMGKGYPLDDVQRYRAGFADCLKVERYGVETSDIAEWKHLRSK